MDMKKIRELVKMMEGSSLTELTLKDNEMEICLSKAAPAPVLAMPAAPVPAAPAAAPSRTVHGRTSIRRSATGCRYSSSMLCSATVYLRTCWQTRR